MVKERRVELPIEASKAPVLPLHYSKMFVSILVREENFEISSSRSQSVRSASELHPDMALRTGFEPVIPG